MKLFKIFLWILSMFITVNLFSQDTYTICVNDTATSCTLNVYPGDTIRFVSGMPGPNSFYKKVNNQTAQSLGTIQYNNDICKIVVNDTISNIKVYVNGGIVFAENITLNIHYMGNESNSLTKLLVFPNPTTEILNITGVEVNDVKVYDMNGRVVMSQSFNSETTVVLDVLYLDNGIYFAVVNNKETMKFIKK